MSKAMVISRVDETRYTLFAWRYQLAISHKIVLALGMAVVTGLLAQLRFYLPWTPVPVTGQTAAVFLTGILLGGFWGGTSQALYVILGAAGIPWFSGWSGGLGAVFGPTGGYIIGFIVAAGFIGYVSDHYPRFHKFIPMFLLMFFANFALIHIPGVIQLGLWMALATQNFSSVWNVVMIGSAPFILGDIIKIAVIAGIAAGITPKKHFINR